MFQLASGFYHNYMSETQISLLFIGLDEAGKTTLLERVKVTDFANPPKIKTGKRIVLEPLTAATNGSNRSIGMGISSKDETRIALPEEVVPSVTPEKEEITPEKEETNEASSNSSISSSSIRNSNSNSNTTSLPPTLKTASSSSPSRRRLFSCPAPPSYRKSVQDDEEDDDDEEMETNTKPLIAKEAASSNDIIPLAQNERPTSPINPPPKQTQTQEEDSRNGSSTPRGLTNDASTASQQRSPSSPLSNSTTATPPPMEYDTKPNTKMFPLSAIRPTLGQNLKKIKALGTQLTMYDVGGSVTMRPLWERYYGDVDGIVYVVDIGKECPVSKLMESRALYNCMRDEEGTEGIPILIFGNEKESVGQEEEDEDGNTSSSSHRIPQQDEAMPTTRSDASAVVGDTSLLDITALFLSPPRGLSGVQQHHHHSTMQCGLQENVAFFAGSAKTGEGVRAAFEWLIRRSVHLHNKGGKKLSHPPV